MKSVGFSAEAIQELADAAVWYETRQAGLAARFLEEVDQTQLAIQSRPRSFPRLGQLPADLEVRRALLPRFPYALIFLELPTAFLILAIAHTKREPDYWLNRVLPDSFNSP